MEKNKRGRPRGKADPPTQTSPPLGSEGIGGRSCGKPGRKLHSAGGNRPWEERQVKPGPLGLRRRQGDLRLSPRHERGAEKGRKVKKPVRLQVSRSRRAETLPETGSGIDAARRSGAAPNAQDLKTAGGKEPIAPDPTTPGAQHDPTTRPSGAAAAFVRPRRPQRGRAHGAPGQPRGAPTSSSRRAAPSLSVSSPPARGLARSLLLSQTRRRWCITEN